jgi:putative transposase
VERQKGHVLAKNQHCSQGRAIRTSPQTENGGYRGWMNVPRKFWFHPHPSMRMQGWDYTSRAAYFVTICTRPKIDWFGHINAKTMYLSAIGDVVDGYWQQIPEHYPYVTLDEYVVMPDHFHGIIIMDDRPNRSFSQNRGCIPRPPAGSLGSIINQFKTVCTKRIRAIGFPDFTWQTRYHEQMIRDENAMRAIRQYIRNNPAVWHRDRNNR